MFQNPILPTPSADPWIVQHNGFYYHCESRHNRLFIRKSAQLQDIGQDAGTCVWSPPATGMNSQEVWAPELHRIHGRWFIYYAADDGKNENHRMWVLESESDDPFGPYLDRGFLETGAWAIDGTPLLADDGSLYFVWSGWPGKRNGKQNLYISRMKNPCELEGERVRICSPTERWETVAMPIAEGPQILKRNGKVMIVYSASGSWTPDYCLGMLVNRDGNFMNPASWEKRGPVFKKTARTWGVGHCSFVQSPDGAEDWIVYHVKTKLKKGWGDRNVHMQKFNWDSEGLPVFGTPSAAGDPLPVPGGSALNFPFPNGKR